MSTATTASMAATTSLPITHTILKM